MALLICITPAAGDEFSTDGRYAKYFGATNPPTALLVGDWQAFDYGKEPWFIVFADVTPAERTAITANADVTAIPASLDNAIGGALATVQAKLEAANLPSQWVTSVMTWRTLVKNIVRLLPVVQRFRGLAPAANRLFDAGLTLDSTLGDIPATPRQRLNQAAQQLGLDTSSLTLATTIRSALVTLAQQLPLPTITAYGSTV